MKVNPIFSENAVLQRGTPTPVWGTADDGETVTVSFQEQSVTTTAKNGKWMVMLEPLQEGGPFTMRIVGRNNVEIKSILVGEVWLAGGQSNMQWPLENTDTGKQEIAASDDPMLRMLRIPMKQSLTPLEETECDWKISGPSTAGAFSAVGYYFAKELRQALGCPVGIIDNSRGGTRIESWMSPKALEPFEGQFVRMPYEPTAEIPVSPHTASALWNAMTVPVIPYAIRGFIWYQGESNANNAWLYRELFPALIADWRNAWSKTYEAFSKECNRGSFDISDPEALPFLFVQLAPLGAMEYQPEGSRWAEVREAQFNAARTVPNTAMAVITDCGANDAHPVHKKTVGHRLALAARALAYGEKLEYRSPYYRSMHIDGSQVTLEFDNAEDGLVAKGGDLKGFVVAGEDGVFHEAKATIHGSTVVVSSKAVPKPVAVRFGWSDGPVVNLYNQAGLPASPFRTDNLPMLSKQG